MIDRDIERAFKMVCISIASAIVAGGVAFMIYVGVTLI